MTSKIVGLSRDRLLELLDYDPISGIFIWKVNRCWQAMKGSIAGNKKASPRGPTYLAIKIDRVEYMGHHLAWLYVTGERLTSEIDHINGDGLDNSFENLRPASTSQNQMNRGVHRNSKSGIRGVFPRKWGKWESAIRAGGKKFYLGIFDTKEEAASAYATASKRLHGEFGHV